MTHFDNNCLFCKQGIQWQLCTDDSKSSFSEFQSCLKDKDFKKSLSCNSEFNSSNHELFILLSICVFIFNIFKMFF